MKVHNLEFQRPFSVALKSLYFASNSSFSQSDLEYISKFTIVNYLCEKPLGEKLPSIDTPLRLIITINFDLIESDVFVTTLIIERQRTPAHIAASG